MSTKTKDPELEELEQAVKEARIQMDAKSGAFSRTSEFAGWECPKCGGQTVHDPMEVYDRCLGCGWYQKRHPNAKNEGLTAPKGNL